MGDRDLLRRIHDLEAQLAALSAGSMRDRLAVHDTSFWVEITGAYESGGAGTGYPWKRLKSAGAVSGGTPLLDDGSVTGNRLFHPSGDTSLNSPQRVRAAPAGCDSSGNALWVVIAGGGGGAPTTLRAEMTGNLAGTGAYSGLEVLAPSAGDISGSSNVSKSLLGTTTGGRTLIIFNYAEVGGAAGSHILEVGIGVRIYTATIIQTNTDGKVVCSIFDALPNGTAKGQVLQMQTSGRFAFGLPTFGT